MAQKRVHNTDELARIDSQLSEEKLFRRALEFADDAKKQELQRFLNLNVALKENAEMEEVYQRAVTLTN